MNSSIQEGLESLFEQSISLSKKFNKKTYEHTFMDAYNEYKGLFASIIEVCEKADDKEGVIDEIASVIPTIINQKTEGITSKRKKENVYMDHNLGIVVYAIPLLGYSHNDYCEQVIDRMIEKWNENAGSLKISKSTFESINGGFKKGLCYITTAVCESLKKADDCYELTLLRDFRDDYLLQQEHGEAIVTAYYDIAPTIVKRINKSEQADEIYQTIWETYLKPCVRLIEEEKQKECRELYSNMVIALQKKYLYS